MISCFSQLFMKIHQFNNMPPQETKTRTKEEIIDDLLNDIDNVTTSHLEQKLLAALDEYAQAKFDSAEAEYDKNAEIDEAYSIGWNACREETRRRFNDWK